MQFDTFYNKEYKQLKGLKRNTIDKFYTKPEIVLQCINYIKEYLYISFKNDYIIEPSAGNGAFIKEIKELTEKYIFYDLEPENFEIIKQDYLKLEFPFFINNFVSISSVKNEEFTDCLLNNKQKENNKIHIIGNPPFGRQSSTVIKFIKKSCQFCNSISFILPKSFKKESLKNYFSLSFHLIFEVDLPDKSFLINNNEYSVDTIFQIWEKKNYNREKNIKIKPLNFIFIKKTDNPDISFRRVGVNAGAINTNYENKSIQSHYFIKFTNNKNINENIILLQNIHFNHNNTVGPRSISKPELIKEFNNALMY